MSRLQKRKQQTRRRKQLAVRNRIRVGNNHPRLSVRRSLTNIYCQVIDDESGRTLASASSRDKDVRGEFENLKKTEVATKVGALIAERAKAAGVVRVAFDRGHYQYHGRVRALAEAAREGGLQF